MEKITKANYKAPLYPIGDKFTMTPARVGHLNQVIDGLSEITLDNLVTTGSVTQTGSNNAPVTINARAGVITMNGPLSPGQIDTYQIDVNNSFVNAGSVVLLTIDYALGIDLADAVTYGIFSVIDGRFSIIIRAEGTTGTPIKINFLVLG
jgi:hypothetical protein